jgi:hypothetical protein
MVALGFVYFLAFSHLFNGICCIPILVACFERVRFGKPLNAIFVAVYCATVIIFLYHTIQVITIAVNVPSKSSLVVNVDNWTGLVSLGWCGFDALGSLFCALSLMFLGVVMTFVPFAIFMSSKATTNRLALIDSNNPYMVPIVLVSVLALPAILIGSYAIASSNVLPVGKRFTHAGWHCTVNYKHFAPFEGVLVFLEFLCGIVSMGMTVMSVRTMQRLKKETIRVMGASQIPEDLILRAFLL